MSASSRGTKSPCVGVGFGRPVGDLLLEEHVHEHVHGLRLDHERAGRRVGVGVVVLVHAVVVHDRDVAGFPLVADAVVDLEAASVEDVEDRLVDVPVHLRLAARRVFLEVDVQRLAEAVFGLHEVLRERLRPRLERDRAALLHARQVAQPVELVLETVFAADLADEDPLVRGVVVRLIAHGLSLPRRETEDLPRRIRRRGSWCCR